jgi:small GTP-binding protein
MADQAKQLPRKINGKVIVVGQANVGKTCLVERFVNDVFAADDPTHQATLGCDCLNKSIFVDSTEVHLFIYDTAGQERFADMASSYYRVGEVCLLCFDMSEMHSFDRLNFWKRKVSDTNERCSFILVGTKEDLKKPDMEIDGVERWAQENGMPFFQTSAKQGGQNIKFLFHTVAEKCLRLNRERQMEGDRNDRIGLQSSIGSSQKGCC